MKSVLLLALRYLRFNKIKTAILVFSVAVAVFLPLAVNLLVRDYQRDLLARAKATPLLAGAPGSRLDLVLHALYFRGKPAHDLAMSDLDAINASGLAMGLPILNKYAAGGLPIVGTSLEYFDFRGLHVADGAGMTRLGDCVLGAAAAETLGLRPGDTLMSDPENVLDLAGSYPINMHVTGILAANGTADDGAVFVDIKTVWLIMGIMHGHQDAADGRSEFAARARRQPCHGQRGLAPLSGSHARERRHRSTYTATRRRFPSARSCVVPHDEKSAAILRGRYQDPKATVQLLVPQQVVAETLDLVFRVKRFFDAQSLLVGVAMGLLLALVVLLSLRLRRGEMETMFKIGCARRMVFWLQAAEILIVLTAGAAIACRACLDDGPPVGPVGPQAAGTMYHGRRPPRRRFAADLSTVPASASRSSTIRWSILRGGSPAIAWRSSSRCRARRTPPSGSRGKSDIRQYQQADLILAQRRRI